jgi:arginase family enzyme
VLIGARNLDPPEEAFIRESGLATGADAIDAALDGADAVYVAFDADVMDAGEVPSFMPEPDGLSVDEAERVLRLVAERSTVAGAGLTGVTPDPAGLQPLARLVAALGL